MGYLYTRSLVGFGPSTSTPARKKTSEKKKVTAPKTPKTPKDPMTPKAPRAPKTPKIPKEPKQPKSKNDSSTKNDTQKPATTGTSSKTTANTASVKSPKNTTTKKSTTMSAQKKEKEKRPSKRPLGDDEDSIQPSKIKRQAEEDSLLSKKDQYKLKRVILGHGHLNHSASLNEDGEPSLDIWACKFEPSQSDKLNPLVAIASSYTLLFLDTRQGRIVKKYTHTEVQEVFYSLDWTVLKTGSNTLKGHESCTLLAAAGRLGSIKLFNPLQNQCYRYLFGHSKSVMKLTFSKKEPRWLCSASADYTVRLWDIGLPTSDSDDSVCLAKFTLPDTVGHPSAACLSYDLSTLMVGCNEGELVHFKLTQNHIKDFKKIQEEHNDDEDGYDAAVKITPHVIYSGSSEWHDGYIDDVCILGQDGDTSNPLNNMIVTRGSNDFEIIVWDPKKSTKKDANILISLEWPDSDDCSGLRMNVYENKGQKILVAGDYDGGVRIFNIGDGRRSKLLDDNSLEQFKPDVILSDPQSTSLIRDVCYCPDLRTLVCVNADNHIFVWTCD